MAKKQTVAAKAKAERTTWLDKRDAVREKLKTSPADGDLLDMEAECNAYLVLCNLALKRAATSVEDPLA